VKPHIKTIIICPQCGKPFHFESTRKATYVNCPACSKTIPVRAKEKHVKVVCCPRCKVYQPTRATVRFKCRMCGYSDRMDALKIYYKTLKSRDATLIAQKLNEARKGK